MIRNGIVTFFMVFCVAVGYADRTDSLVHHDLVLQNISARSKEKPYQYGFRIGVNIPLSKEYSNRDYIHPSLSAEFAGFFRYGKTYIFGEIGFGYMFQKGRFDTYFDQIGGQPQYEPSIVEMRYLQIPLKAVGYYPFKENYAFFGHVGFMYQPLIQVTRNFIEYSRSTMNIHQCLVTTGIGFKIYVVTVELSYRKSMVPFFKNRGKKYPDFLTVSLGFQL